MMDGALSVAVFHGSPRKGNTYFATGIFMDELSKRGEVEVQEFFLPASIPEFCTGCQLCLGAARDACPHSRHVEPIYEAIMAADALVLTTPHHGASDMSAGMKNLMDHLDFFALTVAPRREIFEKRAFILTTGTGSASAIAPIRRGLKHWGLNRVYALGIRMFTNQWADMPDAKRKKNEERLRRAARKFHRAPKRHTYISTIFMYYMSKYILKRYVGEGAYPYEHWREMGYFRKRPF